MTHGEIVAEIQRRAADRGLLSHYCRDSRRCDGNRGLPDLLIAGLKGAVFIEVKTSGQKLQPDQTRWRYTLISAGEMMVVIREPNLDDGTLDRMLDSLAFPGISSKTAAQIITDGIMP